MKILLINQPDKNTLLGNNPEILESGRGHNPPLGLLYVAAVLEKEGMDVEILDAQVEELDYDEVEKRIRKVSPDVVGMTLMTFTIFDVKKTAQLVRKINPNIKIVVGGPHVFIFPKETVSQPWIDAALIGEAEINGPEFFKSLWDEKKLKKVQGACFIDKNGEYVINYPKNMITDLDSVPFPARHLTPYMKYSSVIAKRTPITTMFTSRGCPYNCLFCNRPHLGKKFRARSAENVVAEIEQCVNMGIYEFLIYDDTFTIQRQRVVDICNLLIEKKLNEKIGFDIRARVNTVDEELLKLLKKAGCERIHYGVEAGTEKILKVLRKGITLEQAEKVFKLTKKIGISTLAYFMIGSPTETREDILKTIDFAIKLDPDFVHITITTPFPDTPLYTKALIEKVIEKDVWREFAKNPREDFIAPHWNKELNDEELFELIKYAYKKFYLRPSYIIKKLFSIRSFDEFKRKAKAGLSVLLYK